MGRVDVPACEAGSITRLPHSLNMTTARKYRLRFAKNGDLRLISHHDMIRCLERMVRRARIPLAMSQGFTPRPRIVFASPLALGIVGREEAVDVELTEPVEPADLLRRLAEVAPNGLEWLEAVPLSAGSSAPIPSVAEYCVDVPEDRWEQTRLALDSLLSSAEYVVTRRRPDRGRETRVNLRPFVESAELTASGTLKARLRMGPDGSVRPEELLEALGLRGLLDQGAILERTRLELLGDR